MRLGIEFLGLHAQHRSALPHVSARRSTLNAVGRLTGLPVALGAARGSPCPRDIADAPRSARLPARDRKRRSQGQWTVADVVAAEHEVAQPGLLVLTQRDRELVRALVADAAAEQVEAELVGGDITRGPLTIGVTALGETLDAPLTRGAAQAGDQLWLTGATGQAAAAVAGLAAGVRPDASLLTRLDRPQARCAAGRAARGLAHAAIDVSDGVLADLDHLLKESRLGARLDADALRPTAAMQALADTLGEAPAPWIWTGGDDYELLVAVPPERAQTLASIWAEQGLAPLCIGELVDAPGLQWQGDAPTIDPVSFGFRHF